jgi:hypothetical protein
MIINQKIYQEKRLVNGAMDSITEIIWPLFQRAQLYDLAVKIDFGETGVYQIDAMTVQFPVCYGPNKQNFYSILYNFRQNLAER